MAEQEQVAQAPTAQNEQPQTGLDVWNKVCAQASLRIGRPITYGSFPLGHLYAFWRPTGPTTRFEVGKPLPFRPALEVFAIFRDADEVRVYAMPTQEADSGGPVAPSRVTLSRTVGSIEGESMPDMFFEVMGLSVMIREMAIEVEAAIDDGGEPDLEGEEEDDDEPS